MTCVLLGHEGWKARRAEGGVMTHADPELLAVLLRLRENYLATIEHTLLAIPVPSGLPGVSRAFADIHSLIKHGTAEIDEAIRRAEGLREDR